MVFGVVRCVQGYLMTFFLQSQGGIQNQSFSTTYNSNYYSLLHK